MGKINWRLEEEEEGPSAGGDRLGQSGSGIAITLMGKEDGIKGYWNGNLPQILIDARPADPANDQVPLPWSTLFHQKKKEKKQVKFSQHEEERKEKCDK
ncbi:auxin transporter-like protein 1 [Musa troglodytarum]|uniref:Auxin transporter-like protein 1 n=1 Tax=Musa troglodytarum TaxID=320322 RepID=A0A9E7EL90_9LILI|nr:auxin transporter-like protein 1 [Musa troglodytarum]